MRSVNVHDSSLAGRHTGVLGRGHDLGQELGKVGQVVAEEAGFENKSLTVDASGQLTTEELSLALDAEGRTVLGALQTTEGQLISRHLTLHRTMHHALHTLKANSPRPALRPGRGWKRVPALATTASLVVGAPRSREATLRPETSRVSNDADEAAAA